MWLALPFVTYININNGHTTQQYNANQKFNITYELCFVFDTYRVCYIQFSML